MKAKAGDESRDQMKCQESQESKEIGAGRLNKQTCLERVPPHHC